MLRFLLGALLCLTLGTTAGAETFTIGYLQLKKDARYSKTRSYAQFLLEPLGRPYTGAKVALDEIQFHGTEAGVTFKLDRERERDTAALISEAKRMHGEGVRFFVTDLSADVLAELAEATAGMDLILMNATARDDHLRAEGCQPHLLHIIPSQRMLMDALNQYLRFKKWTKVLVLQGPSEDDQAMGAAYAASARKFGMDVIDTRPFLLSNDPRDRDLNNILLLTSDGDYDVVFVADAVGEFARNIQYQTVLPRPVVGASGLGAVAWHWAWERHGAPQLEGRFEDMAERKMRSYDWATWMAVKTVAEAVQRTGSADFNTLRDFLLGPELNLDTFKGNPSSFRTWNNQLRQPVLIGTQNWVIARAPIEGFEHRVSVLDTLGIDQRESVCRLDQ